MINKIDTCGKITGDSGYISKQTQKPYRVIQVDWNLPKPEVPILRKGEIPLPAPELGGIIHGVEFTTTYLEPQKLNKPEEINGVICHYRVNEITHTDNNIYCKRSVYIEGDTCIGKQHAEGFKSLMERIYRDEQQELRQQIDKQTDPEHLITEKTLGDGTPISIESRSVDHHLNRKEAATALQRKEYPNLYHALDGLNRAKDETERKKWAEKARQGFIVDLKKNTGNQLDAEGATELLKDNAFIELLNEVNKKPRKKQNLLKWALVLFWINRGYYKMKEQELAAAIKRDTGLIRKGSTIARLARKLGLETGLKRGRPEKLE